MQFIICKVLGNSNALDFTTDSKNGFGEELHNVVHYRIIIRRRSRMNPLGFSSDNGSGILSLQTDAIKIR
jgi:hypothetical protein